MNTSDKQRMWAEVNLDHIIHNYQFAKRLSARRVLPVLKADAYGHGAITVAQTLVEEGVEGLAVATATEALQLRYAGIQIPLLVLGTVPATQVKALAKQGITIALPNLQAARLYKKELEGDRISVHIKLDSGMHRLGFSGKNTVEEILEAVALGCFELEGMFTHFAAAGESDKDLFTRRQYAYFESIIEELKRKGMQIPLVHCANTDALLHYQQFYADMVRPGLLLYGYVSCNPNPPELKPALQLKSRVGQVHWIEAGQSVGYSCSWTAARPTKVAVISCGYADGLPRSGSGKLQMLVRGKRALQIGRVCMDMCMLDVTDIEDVQVGDIITIIGTDGLETISAIELGECADTIPQEILTRLAKRVPRYYYRNGQVVGAMALV